MSKNENLCPCGSGKTYGECCEPIIKGSVKAPSAETCMRARYSSYVKHEIDFIIKSCDDEEGLAEIDKKATEDWSRQSQWNGLKILRTEKAKKKVKKLLNSQQIILFTICTNCITKFPSSKKSMMNGNMLQVM